MLTSPTRSIRVLTFAAFGRLSAAHPSSRFETADGVPWIRTQARRHHAIVDAYLRYRGLTDAPSPRILDVGAYPGTLLKLLRVGLGERGLMAGVGLEGSTEFADDLRQYDIEFRRVNLDPVLHVDHSDVLGLPARIPYEDGAFDFAFCTEVLEHLLDPRVSLREIARVLAPRGCVLVTTPNHARAANRLKLLVLGASVNFALAESIPYNKGNWRPHIREYTLSELRCLVQSAGFRPLAERYLDLSGDDVRLFQGAAWRVRAVKAALRPFQLVPSWRHTILSVMQKRDRPCG